jgi:hypothetical protein
LRLEAVGGGHDVPSLVARRDPSSTVSAKAPTKRMPSGAASAPTNARKSSEP